MGADLLGMLVKGPREIGSLEAKKERFLKRLDATKEWVKDFQDDVVRDGPSWVVCVDPEFDGDTILEMDPEIMWEETLELWRRGQARDCFWRQDPQNPKMKIMFCGEPSWGDPPEGHGYQTLRRAEMVGLLEILGIK